MKNSFKTVNSKAEAGLRVHQEVHEGKVCYGVYLRYGKRQYCLAVFESREDAERFKRFQEVSKP